MNCLFTLAVVCFAVRGAVAFLLSGCFETVLSAFSGVISVSRLAAAVISGVFRATVTDKTVLSVADKVFSAALYKRLSDKGRIFPAGCIAKSALCISFSR